MAFKSRRKKAKSAETPVSLFHDLRRRSVQGLLSHQADVLRAYAADAVELSDVAFQLPTGSGKTLVGLLVAEWRRVTRGERVVFLCPTRQLVNQVVSQAEGQYGIHTNGFVGKKRDYDAEAKAEYANAEAVAVTTYSSLFNISPYFERPDVVLFDDAHAAENYVAAHWSVRVLRDEHAELFRAIASCLKDSIAPLDHRRLTEDSNEAWDLSWGDKLPGLVFADRSEEIADVIDEFAEDDISQPHAPIRHHAQAWPTCTPVALHSRTQHVSSSGESAALSGSRALR